MRKHGLHILALILVAWSCTTQQNLQQVNLSHLYQEEGVVLKPLFKVYHESQELSRVYFQASSDQLLYIKDREEELYRAQVGVRYALYTDYARTALIDSGSAFINYEKSTTETEILLGDFDLHFDKRSKDEKYLLEVKLIDLNRNLSYIDLIAVDRSDNQTRQSFLLTTPKNRVIFRNHYPLDVPFFLKHGSNPQTYTVRFYDRDFPIATTPYSKNMETKFRYKADSTFQVNANDTLYLPKHGFYHFQLNEESKNGFTLFSFYQEFPMITRRRHLGQPLRYITTQDEFNKIMSTDDQKMKLEVDKFWLENARNVDKGKALISSYYNRVEAANMFFSSYLEGWKTDRGIVYVVLGPPSQVTRNQFQEIWIYGDPNSSLSYVYTFTLVKNPFCNNDYALNRSSSYRYGWSQAIDSWRKGRAFGIREIKQAQDERDRQVRVNNPPYFWY